MYRITHKLPTVLKNTCHNNQFLIKCLSHIGKNGNSFSQNELENFMANKRLDKNYHQDQNPFATNIKNYWQYYQKYHPQINEYIEPTSSIVEIQQPLQYQVQLNH